MAAREPAVDRERAAEPSWAATGRLREAAPGERLCRPDEDAACDAGTVHGHIEAVVHAVDEVDVEGTGRPEERLGTRCRAAEDVGGRITLAEVGLSLDDTRR
jgi:hypothetical protein